MQNESMSVKAVAAMELDLGHINKYVMKLIRRKRLCETSIAQLKKEIRFLEVQIESECQK